VFEGKFMFRFPILLLAVAALLELAQGVDVVDAQVQLTTDRNRAGHLL